MASTVVVDKTQVSSIRKGLFERIREDDYDEKDMERYKTEDAQIARHINTNSKKKGQDLVDETISSMLEMLEWRAEMGVANPFDGEDFSPDIVKVFKSHLFEGGREKKNGAKVYWSSMKNWKDEYFFNIPDCKRYMAHLWEKIDVENWNEKGFTYWFDYNKVGMTSMFNTEISKYNMKFMSYYLGGLKYLGIYDMPKMLRSAWPVIVALAPSNLSSSTILVTKEELNEYIEASDLPEIAK